MGIFDFIKDVGEMLGIGTAAAADADSIKNAIIGHGLKIDDLSVAVDGETAQVGGKTQTQEIKEKVILTAGNVKGIGKVEENITVAAPEPEAAFYTVKKGDTLSAVAKAQYGNAGKYMTIFNANKPMLKDPDLIYPGQVLRIPQQA